MFIKCSISAVALAAALTASTPTMAQLLDTGVSVDLGGTTVDADVTLGGDSGTSVNATVDSGGGGGGLSVDADVGVGGDGGTSLDADVGIGGDGGADVDVDAEIGSGKGATGVEVKGRVGRRGSDTPPVQAKESSGPDVKPTATTGSGRTKVDANLTSSGGTTTAPKERSTKAITGELRLLAIGEEKARAEALVELLADPKLAEIDLDVEIDDTLVSIVPVTEAFGEDTLLEITATLGEQTPGRTEVLDAVEASVELTAILGREGVAPENVLAVQVGEFGHAEVFVLPADDLASDAIVDAEIELLTTEKVLGVDVALLDETARLQLVLDLLNDTGGPAPVGETGIDELALIDIDALLGKEALAEIDVVIGEEDTEAALLEIEGDITVLDVLKDADISPDAIVAVRVLPTGETGLFLSETLSGIETVAIPALDLGTGLAVPRGSTQEGGTETGGPMITPTNGGTPKGLVSGTSATNSTGQPRPTGGSASTGTSARVAAITPNRVTALLLPCSVAAPILGAADDIDAQAVIAADSAAIVEVETCRIEDLPSSDELADVRAAIGGGGVALASLSEAGYGVEDVIGASVDDEDLVLYVSAGHRR